VQQALISRFFSTPRPATETTRPRGIALASPGKPAFAPLATKIVAVADDSDAFSPRKPSATQLASDGVGKRVRPARRPTRRLVVDVESDDSDIDNASGGRGEGLPCLRDGAVDEGVQSPAALGNSDRSSIDKDNAEDDDRDFDHKNEVDLDWDSDNIGDGTTPLRKKRRLIVADNPNSLPQELEGPCEVVVPASIRKSDIDVHPLAAYMRNFGNGQQSAGQSNAAPRNEQNRRRFQSKIGRLEQNSYYMRRTGGCGGGGDDVPSPNAHPSADAGNQYSVHGPRDSLHSATDNGTSNKKGKATPKYTPLEQQFVEVKRKHPELLLLVECGYKFRFFGEDADIASRVCRIYSYFDHNFNTASIPSVRLAHHVGRLVQAGQKVGLVRQIETAALKRASDKASGPFSRQLCEIYTRGTIVADGQLGGHSVLPESMNAAASASYIAACFETTNSADKPAFAFVAVDTATGDVIIDSFSDDMMRSGLDARLLALEPVEIIVSMTEMSNMTERTIAHFCHACRARLERVNDADFSDCKINEQTPEYSTTALRKVVMLACESWNVTESEKIFACACALATYLKQFKLERAMFSAREYRSFSASREMHIGAEAMRNFEIFQNANDGGKAGSLLCLVDRTKTSFGSRRIKQWLAHPLTNSVAIRDRLDAVDCLRHLIDGAFEAHGGTSGSLTPDACVAQLVEALSKLPDLERGLARISYEKCTPAEFVAVVSAFQHISTLLRSLRIAVDKEVLQGEDLKAQRSLSAGLLSRMIDEVPEIASALDSIVYQRLDLEAAKANNYKVLYVTNVESAADAASQPERNLISQMHELVARCEHIEKCEGDLKSLLSRIRSRHSLRTALEWKKVAQEEYLLEIPIQNVTSVPHAWVVVNQTKSCKRYRPPEAKALLELLEQARELCDEQASVTWRSYLNLFSTMEGDLRSVVRFLGDLDCLASLARLSCLPGYCKPIVLDASISAGLHATNARHPVAEAFSGPDYVPNDVRLGLTNAPGPHRAPAERSHEQIERCMVLTGPNMGGKSSYIRMTALIAIMVQTGSFVPASSATLSPFDGVFCRMGASDAIGKGMSTLMMELSETSKIMEKATERSLIILDELGRGTATHDGTAIAHATLGHMIRSIGGIVLFVTHFPALARIQDEFSGTVGSHFMDYIEEDIRKQNATEQGHQAPTNSLDPDSVTDNKKITFLYKVTRGVAKQSYGLNVALLAGLPTTVVEMAATAASQFDRNDIADRCGALFRKICSVLASESDDQVVSALKDCAIYQG
jgi:DNA mismatch repair protein MSH3